MQRIITIVLTLALALSACTTPQGAVPPSGGIQPFVTSWNWHQWQGDSQIAEVVQNNSNSAGSRVAFESYLANGGKVDLFINCDDGRVSACSQYYAAKIANGGVAPYHFEIGSLAGEVTPEMLSEINKWIDKGWIRSINISSHTCATSTCGAQGVKAELQAGKSVSEFEAHGVGEAARWIEGNLDSANPVEQVAAQVSKVFEGIGRRVTVLGWVADHGTQERELVAELYSGLDPNEIAIRDELVRLNNESAKILGPQAQAEGLATAQHLRHIIVVQTEVPWPVEVLAGLPEGGLDNAFNASVVVSHWANEEQIQSAFAAAKAGLQYALAHATPETEVFFMFEDKAFLERFMKEIEGWKVYQDFLANTSFQEVTAFLVDKTGNVTGSLLIKPAYTAVSPAMTIGPNFRSDYVSDVFEHQGKQWANIHGEFNPVTGNSVLVTVDAPGVYRFVRTFTKYEDAQFYLNGNLAGEPELDGQLSIAKWGNNGGIVYTPDFGEDLFTYLERTNQWHLLPQYMQEIEEMLLMKAGLGFVSRDIYHVDQFRVNSTGRLHMADWSRLTTETGEKMLARYGGSLASYQLFVQRDLADMVNRQAVLAENMGLTPIRQYLPLQWSAPASSSFYFTGSQATIAAEQAIAFERALVNLGSTSPETVAAARNWLSANGAVQIDGQWVLFGQRSIYASGPIRFANLSTYYPDGAKAFVGFQTPRGVFGFERAENVLGGMGGWRVYAPGLNQVGAKLNQLGPMIGKVAVVVWAGFVAGDVVAFSEQTEYTMVVSQQLLQPPTSPSAYFWFPNEKTPYVATRWEISLAELQSGCNGTGLTADGCGAYLPEGQRSPIALVGALAGEYLPQQSWPSFGLDGNNVLLSWEYLREGSTFTIWHNGQMVDPGSSLDYYEPVFTQDGMWLVPYHAELMTATCVGLCVQQSHGGEELRFLDGAQPVSLDLCPVSTTGEDPCLWRP